MIGLATRRPWPTASISALGTARLLRGALRAGYTPQQVTAALNWPPGLLDQFTRGTRHHTNRAVADHVDHVVYQMLARPAPTGAGAKQARRVAREQGWHPVWAWDDIDDPHTTLHGEEPADEVAVERAVDGWLQWGGLNPAERVEVYHQVTGQGVSLNEFARRYGVSSSTFKDFTQSLAKRKPVAA